MFGELERWTALPFRSVGREVTERKEGTLLHHLDPFQVAGVTSSILNEPACHCQLDQVQAESLPVPVFHPF